MSTDGTVSEEVRRQHLAILFRNLDNELSSPDPSIPDTTIELVVSGQHGGRWLVITQGGSGCVREGAQSVDADADVQCRIETDMRTVAKLANGDMKPAMALLRGKVRYSGTYTVFRNLQQPFRRAAQRTMVEIGPENIGSHISKLSQGSSTAAGQQEWSQITFILDSSHPEWENNADRCKLCLARFTFWTRQHHCRRCGSAICSNCSNHQLKGHRVCTACWQDHIHEVRPSGTRSEAGSVATPTAPPASKENKPFMLPYQYLIEHIRNIQSRPIGAMVESSAMSILQTSRTLLLRIRSLEETVRGQAERSLTTRFWRLVNASIPQVMLTGVLTLAWATTLWGLQQPSAGRGICSLALLSLYWNRPVVQAASLGLASWALQHPIMPLVTATTPWTSYIVTIACSRPLLFTSLMSITLISNMLSYFFGRLFRIYSTAAVIIISYYSTYLVCMRAMGMSATASTKVFESLDTVMAPYACNEILSLRSVFVKFGQYIGSRADIIPPKWALVLAKLQDDLPADDPKYVEKCIEEQFGFKIDKLFESFDLTPLASASVAQVHRAKIKPNVCPTGRIGPDGKIEYIKEALDVAVKVQHQGIEAIMRSDVVAFGRIVSFIAWLNPRFEIAVTLLRAWEKEMLKELDFRVEAENLRNVRANLRQAGLLADNDYDYLDKRCVGSHVLVPRPIYGFISKRAFCMTFIHGFKITDLEQLSLFGVDRSALVKRVVQAYGCMIFVDGLTSADPHPGNLMVMISDNGTARPILLDFGMVVTLEPKQRLGYCKLVNSIANISVSGLSDAVAQVGYKNSQSDAHPERDLEFFAHLLRDTGDRKSQRQSQVEFRKRRKAQRTADLEQDPSKQGRFFANFPDSLIFLFRVLGLIRGLCTTLDAPISYLDIMGDYAKLGLLHDALEEAASSERKSSVKSELGSTRPTKGLTTREITLEKKVQHLLRETQQAAWQDLVETRDPSLGSGEEGFVVDGFLGAQVCVMSSNRVIVNAFTGVEAELSPVCVDSETLFPLMDITRVLPVVAVLRLVEEGRISLADKISQHWTSFVDKHLTLGEVLSYSPKINDSMVPATKPANALANYEAVKQSLESTSKLLSSASSSKKIADPLQSQYSVFTFGFILTGLLEAVLSAPIKQIIEEELLNVHKLSGEAIYLSASQAPVNSRFAQTSNGFAKFVRTLAMGGAGSSIAAGMMNPGISPSATSETTGPEMLSKTRSSSSLISTSSRIELTSSEVPTSPARSQSSRTLRAGFTSPEPAKTSSLSKVEQEPTKLPYTRVSVELNGESEETLPRSSTNVKYKETAPQDSDTESDDEEVSDEDIKDDEDQGGGLLPPGVKLPSGVMLDPCCVNSESLRKGIVPSFGGFATAKGAASLLDSFFSRVLSKPAAKKLLYSAVRSESNQLFGHMAWSHGFQVCEMPDTRLTVLVMHAFGGSMIIAVPERRVTISIMVNCLTLDRATTREILALICKELNLTNAGVDQLFRGMF